MAEQRENFLYAQFGDAVRELALTIADDGYVPDVILGIVRGGLFLAGGLAYALDCKNVQIVNVEFYSGVGATSAVPVMLEPRPNGQDLASRKVLVVDDVVDTGSTLRLVHEFCSLHAAEVRVAAFFEKSHAVIKSDYVWKRTDLWVNFPWSVAPPVQRGNTTNFF